MLTAEQSALAAAHYRLVSGFFSLVWVRRHMFRDVVISIDRVGMEAAKDAACSALLSAASTYKQGGKASFKTYVICCMRRAINTLAENRRRQFEDSFCRLPKTVAVPSDLGTDADTRDSVQSALSALSKRQQEVVYARFLAGKTLEAIGNTHGVTKERIRQILASSLKRMKAWLLGHPIKKLQPRVKPQPQPQPVDEQHPRRKVATGIWEVVRAGRLVGYCVTLARRERRMFLRKAYGSLYAAECAARECRSQFEPQQVNVCKPQGGKKHAESKKGTRRDRRLERLRESLNRAAALYAAEELDT